MIDFFRPLSQDVIAHLESLPESVLGNSMRLHTEEEGFPDLDGVKMVVFGVKEIRKKVDHNGVPPNFDAIRKAFYGLYPGNWEHALADIGDINPGNSVEDTYFALSSVVTTLLKKKLIPIILGGSQDLVYANYRAYDYFDRMVNLVNIDSKFDIGNAEETLHNNSYIGKIVVEKPFNLFNYSNIGYQSYFNHPDEIALVEKLYFDSYRLGEVVNDITLVEPIIRDADLVSLDVGAIKGSELSYNKTRSPNGFDGREICAIARYSGISNRVSSFGIYELEDYTETENAALLIAQILWYFIEGVNYRIDDGDMSVTDEFVTYKVLIEEEVLIFKKSLKTERWWIGIPFVRSLNNKLKSWTLLPCSHQDYIDACNQEIPERWYKARRKNEI